MYERAARDAEALGRSLGWQSANVPGWEGDARRAHDAMMRRVFEDSGIAAFVDAAGRISSGVRETAAQVEKAKYQAVIIGAWLAASIAWALAVAPFTGGASLGWLAAVEAFAEQLLRQVGVWLVRGLVAAGAGALFMVTADVLAQGIVIGEGHSDHFDAKSVLISAGMGGLAGLLGLGVMTGLARGEVAARGALAGSGAGGGELFAPVWTMSLPGQMVQQAGVSALADVGFRAAQGTPVADTGAALAQGAVGALGGRHGAVRVGAAPKGLAEALARLPGAGGDSGRFDAFEALPDSGAGFDLMDGLRLEVTSGGALWARPREVGTGSGAEVSAFASAVRGMGTSQDGLPRLVVGTPDTLPGSTMRQLERVWEALQSAPQVPNRSPLPREIVLATPVTVHEMPALQAFVATHGVSVSVPSGRVLASAGGAMYVAGGSAHVVSNSTTTGVALGQWLQITPIIETTNRTTTGLRPPPTPDTDTGGQSANSATIGYGASTVTNAQRIDAEPQQLSDITQHPLTGKAPPSISTPSGSDRTTPFMTTQSGSTTTPHIAETTWPIQGELAPLPLQEHATTNLRGPHPISDATGPDDVQTSQKGSEHHETPTLPSTLTSALAGNPNSINASKYFHIPTLEELHTTLHVQRPGNEAHPHDEQMQTLQQVHNPQPSTSWRTDHPGGPEPHFPREVTALPSKPAPYTPDTTVKPTELGATVAESRPRPRLTGTNLPSAPVLPGNSRTTPLTTTRIESQPQSRSAETNGDKQAELKSQHPPEEHATTDRSSSPPIPGSTGFDVLPIPPRSSAYREPTTTHSQTLHNPSPNETRPRLSGSDSEPDGTTRPTPRQEPQHTSDENHSQQAAHAETTTATKATTQVKKQDLPKATATPETLPASAEPLNRTETPTLTESTSEQSTDRETATPTKPSPHTVAEASTTDISTHTGPVTHPEKSAPRDASTGRSAPPPDDQNTRPMKPTVSEAPSDPQHVDTDPIGGSVRSDEAGSEYAPVPVTPTRLTRAVVEFGTARDGSQGLVHVAPVPERTVTWLQEQVFREVEGDRGEDASFRDIVRRTLNSRSLSSEWARLLSEHGLPVRAPYQGQTYQVAVRLRLSDPRQVPPGITQMPDGPPVNIQRWAFGSSEIGNTDSVGDLRSMSFGYATTWPLPHAGWFRRVTLTPQFTYTHNQTTISVAVNATVQPMILLRSRERSWPYEYAMHWQIRATTGLRHATTTVESPDRWHTLQSPPSALTVWFPKHLAEDEADPATLAHNESELTPAPLTTLLTSVPLFAVESVPHADRLLSDVLLSFERDLEDISEPSLEELRQFLGEGTLRGHLPLMYGGTHTTPTLFAKNGSVIGMLRIQAHLQEQGDYTILGPPTRNSVLESHVLRSVRMVGSAAVANASGLGLGASGGFAAGHPDQFTGVERIGFTLTGQVATQHEVTHTLNSGGSARTSHSLRTGKPLLRVGVDVVYDIRIVRPDGPEQTPAEDTPLAKGTPYPLILRVPSVATVSGEPQTRRFLPPEILHLRSLGVSTTPLNVSGTKQLFDSLETWLRDRGFLPPAQETTWYQEPFETALRIPRLQNVRKLEQIRSGLGLRAELDEMIEGGHTVRFELPTATGTQRVSFRMTAERHYLEGPDGGVTHDHHLTGVQTLNYTGSTIPGDEQLKRAPWTLSGTGQISATNPFDGHGNLWLQGLTPEYSYHRQNSTVTGASAGTGHEFYALSPTADGIHLYTIPVTFRTEISWSHGTPPEPGAAHGTVSLALPTYRTETEPSTQAPPEKSRPRPLTEADADEPTGGLRLPETVLLDRVEGSHAVRAAVNEILGGLAREAAVQLDTLQTTTLPGAWVETKPPGTQPTRTDKEIEPENPPRTPHEADLQPDAGAPTTQRQLEEGGTNAQEPVPTWQRRSAQALSGWLHRSATGALEGGTQMMRWTADQAVGAWRWTRRLGVGESTISPESAAQEVLEAGLSPHHLVANAHRIFRDSYVLEGVNTSGVLAGTDVTIEVEGFLTDVTPLPRPGVMDYERWIQSVNASAETSNNSHGHALGVMLAADYGHSKRTFAPSGRYVHRTAGTDSSTMNDNATSFRVTSENDIPAHRFSGTATYKVTVRVGRRNIVTGTVAGGPHREDSRIITIPQALEFLLSDNDLVNHPEFRLGEQPQDPGPSNRLLPPWFVQSNGQIGFGSVTEVHPDGGRSAFQERIRELVEHIAPGATEVGRSTYLPGVLSRINEHGSSLGLRTLVNAGPNGHTTFHFVHRSWLGPQLVEVTLRARPTDDLTTARGRSALKNAGLDTVLGHSNGDGSTLPLPGTTRQTHKTLSANELDFSPLVQHNGHRFRTTLSMTRQTATMEASTSTRERRAWQRSMLDTSEFNLRYSYEATVTATPMDDVLAVALVQLLAATGCRIGQYSRLSQLSASAYRSLPEALRTSIHHLSTQLPRPTQRVNGSIEATSVIRFNGSETPIEATQSSRRVTPVLYTSDPTHPLPAQPGEAIIDMEVTTEVRQKLSGSPWVPTRPFAIYDFDAVPQLADALRAVSPALGGERTLPTSLSSEGIFIRLTQLVQAGRLDLLPPAATAPYLGQPGPTGTSIRVMIYAPHNEWESLDTAIDRVEIATEGSYTQTDLTTTPALVFGYSGPLNSSQTDRIGHTAPLGGQVTTAGQTHSLSAPRREMLRFGTPIAGADNGSPGHQIWAIGLLEVKGPLGTRWVVGNIILRTTERPPRTPGDTSGADVTTRRPPVIRP
ncbi:hypothetical protein ACFXG8_34035 [Kitasatospora indigofera]|uniref:hypothetical protein n=1 Tax=Kitasatospora indigofera TaxID=67307 RepID=UPI0036B86D08